MWAHLIILLPPLGLLGTAQDLLLNQAGVLKVLLLPAEKIPDSVTIFHPLKKRNVHPAGLHLQLLRGLPLEGALLRPLFLLLVLQPLGYADVILHELVLLDVSGVVLLNCRLKEGEVRRKHENRHEILIFGLQTAESNISFYYR